MTTDVAYTQVRTGELVHRYGERVHILSDPYHLSLLATLSAQETVQPHVNMLVSTLYRHMIAAVVAAEFPTVQATVTPR